MSSCCNHVFVAWLVSSSSFFTPSECVALKWLCVVAEYNHRSSYVFFLVEELLGQAAQVKGGSRMDHRPVSAKNEPQTDRAQPVCTVCWDSGIRCIQHDRLLWRVFSVLPPKPDFSAGKFSVCSCENTSYIYCSKAVAR